MQTPYLLSSLISDLNLTVLTDVYEDRQISSGYCCDMLSWAMSRLDDVSCWFTILNSINVIAVAALSGCPCIVLTESVSMNEDVLAKAREENICICMAEDSTFEAAAKFSEALKNR